VLDGETNAADEVRATLKQVERDLKHAHTKGEQPESISTPLGDLHVRYASHPIGGATASVDISCLLPDDWHAFSDGYAHFYLSGTAQKGPRSRLLTDIKRELIALDGQGVAVAGALEQELAADIKRVLRNRGLCLSRERLAVLRDALAQLRLDDG